MNGKNNISIKVENDINSQSWDRFVNTSKNSSFFSLYKYNKLISDESFYILAYDEQGSIIGGLIGRIRGNKFLINLVAKSVWVESGILANVKDEKMMEQVKSDLLSCLESETKKRNCNFINFNHWSRETNPTIFKKNNYKITVNPTYISNLQQDEDSLFKRMSKGHRSTLKKALKSNLTFFVVENNIDKYIDDFYALYKNTQIRAIKNNKNSSMTLKSKSIIKSMLLDKEIPAYLNMVYNDKKLASCAIFVHNSDTMIYYIGASDIDLNKNYGASNFLLWESMLWAKNKKINNFDFGGVPSDPSPADPAFGVFNFKKNFGGELYYFYSGQKIINALKARIFNWVMSHRSVVRFVFNLKGKL